RTLILVFLYCAPAHRAPPSFPTRRSSDLSHGTGAIRDAADADDRQFAAQVAVEAGNNRRALVAHRNAAQASGFFAVRTTFDTLTDRKSTRLNSSHVKISYAVFCLKKKKQ